MKSKTIFLLVLFALQTAFSEAQELYEYASKILVKVKSGKEVSTGFFWLNGTIVITTAHSVNHNGKKVVLVSPLDTTKKIVGNVLHVITDYDIAIIKTTDYTHTEFIHADQISEEQFTEAVAYAFYDLKVNGQDYKSLLPFQSLRNSLGKVNARICTQLANRDLTCDMVILPTAGVSQKGFSGAPVLFKKDGKIRLLGVNEGGIPNINQAWVIPAYKLWIIYLKYFSNSGKPVKKSDESSITFESVFPVFQSVLSDGRDVLEKAAFSLYKSEQNKYNIVLPKGIAPNSISNDYYQADMNGISLYFCNTLLASKNHSVLSNVIRDDLFAGFYDKDLKEKWKEEPYRLVRSDVAGFKSESYFYDSEGEKKGIIIMTKSVNNRFVLFAMKCSGENSRAGWIRKDRETYFLALASFLYSVHYNKN